MGAQTKGCRPPLRTPRLNALVDYEEDDEEYPSNDQAVHAKSTPDPNRPTPSISITTPTPSLSPGPAPTGSLMRPSEKRRRTDDDDDDDELLERLAKSFKMRPKGDDPPVAKKIKVKLAVAVAADNSS